jgi:hypothetical protein
MVCADRLWRRSGRTLRLSTQEIVTANFIFAAQPGLEAET